MNTFKYFIGRLVTTGLAASAFLGSAIALPVTAQVQDTLHKECVAAERNVAKLYESNNRCPQANAGVDLPIQLNQQVPLDASGSSDVDGQLLGFEWTVVAAPKGSAVAVENASSLRTQFMPDLAGDYVFELRVTDSEGAVSSDRVTFSTNNVAPVARTLKDSTAQVGQSVSLDAARSYDLDGDVLAYTWTMLEQPAGSQANVSSRAAQRSSVLLDSEGDYRIELKVHDRQSSSSAELRLSTYNTRPTANAGRTRTVGPDSTIIFDSSRSDDFDSDALSYHWSVLSAPEGYKNGFNNASIDSPSLTLGEQGLYLVQLVVDDGSSISNPATTLIEVKRDRLANFDLNDYLPLVSRAGSVDTDGDGVADPVDNCVLVANAPQRDTDGDGIGNFCDPDLNNDGVVNFLDITMWTPFFLSTDPDADFNGDGTVNFLDYIILTSAFLQQPGPPGTIVWVSLVDGNFNDRTNWEPQIVPSAGATAIIDVAPAVTVTQSGSSITVESLVQNENLVLSNTTVEAGESLQLGGTMTVTNTAINNTWIRPSLAGTGALTVTGSSNNWSNNTISVPTGLNNASNVNNSNGLSVQDATITINASSSVTGFVFTSDQTVSGDSGVIRINGVGNSQITEPRIFPVNGTTLTLGVGLTISGGKGTIGNISAGLNVNGTIAADTAGEALRIIGSSWTGTGTLIATNGGSMQLNGVLDNGGNTLNLDTAGGSLQLLTSGSLRNAILNGQPGTSLNILSGVTSFQNLTLNADMVMDNAANTNVSGGFTLNGNALLNATSSPTGLIFTEDQTIGGNASIRFEGSNNSQITEPRLFPLSGVTVTFAPTVEILGGKGTIGVSNASVIMNGTVNADVDGEAIQILGSPWSGTGTLIASNGGQVLLGGNFDNGGNQLDLDGSDGLFNLLAGASLRNTTIVGTAGTNMTVNSGLTTMEALNYTGDITMVNAANSNVTGGLTLNGTVLIDAPSSPTGLIFLESQNVDGTATIVFDGVGNSVIAEPRLFPQGVDTVVTFGADITIRGGKGTIGQSASNIVLLGDVIADVDGEEIRVGGLSWSSTGSLQSLNGGAIGLYGSLDNAGAAIDVNTAGGQFHLLAGASLANAFFNGVAGTELLVRTGTTTLDGMTFTHDLRHENGANSNVFNGLTINGTSTIVAPTSPTGYLFNESQSLGGAATIVFDSASNSVIAEPRLFPTGSAGTTLTIDSSVVVQGTKATIGQSSRNLVMNGTVISNTAGQSIRVVGLNWSGTGNINATGGGDVELSGNLDNAGQTLSFDTAGGSVTILAGAQLRNAVLDGTAGSAFTFNSGTTTIEDLIVNADMVMNNSANANVFDGLTLNGELTINAPTSPTGLLFNNTQTLGGNATVYLNGAGNSVISEPRLLPTGDGSTVVTIGPNVLVRGGTGTIGSTARALIVEGTISADEGRFNVVGLPLTNNGTLEALNGNVLSIDNLGSSTGDFHAGAESVLLFADAISGFSATSNVFLDIGPSGVPGRIDALFTTNSLDGSLTLSAVDGFAPGVGSIFTLIDQTGPAAGVFSNVNSLGLGAGESFSIDYAADVTAEVVN